MMEQPYGMRIRGTLLTWETPFSPDDPRDYEYPFPDAANQRLYTAYVERAAAIGDVLFCGRLGEYRYYDMDQAIGRGLMLADTLRGQARDEPRRSNSPNLAVAASLRWPSNNSRRCNLSDRIAHNRNRQLGSLPYQSQSRTLAKPRLAGLHGQAVARR
jgi:hypothetical protein